MSRKRRISSESVPELNLKPAMNLILILIPLLLFAMQTVKIVMINVATPQIGPSSEQKSPEEKPDEKPLKLTIALTDRGITIFARDSVVENKDDPLGPTLPKVDGEDKDSKGNVISNKVYDWKGLSEKLADIKEQHPAEEKVILAPEPTTKYRHIIRAMDATRAIKKDGAEKSDPLFPQIILSAGVA